MKFMIVETPHGGGFGPGAADHPHPYPERWRCKADQRVEACFAFRDQPGGIYVLDVVSEDDLEELLAETPVLAGTLREVWAIREV